MIKGYQGDILKSYELIRDEEKNLLADRRKEISEKIPYISDIENQIGKLSIELSLVMLKNIPDKDDNIKYLKNKITELRMRKIELLVSNGYTMDYLDLHYRCPKCKDTGFIGADKCSCFKQKLVSLYYKNSDLTLLLKNNNFSNFDFRYFSTSRVSNEPDSPRKNIEKILSKSWNFINSFSENSENLLFYGTSGTGKTFLSHCIAKELLDKGYFVIYRTADDLIQNLKHIKFNEDTDIENLLLNCDLLIIDDLGSEQISVFSKTELFNLVNKKLLSGKKMIVSTNYSLEEILKSYSERISSRLLGNFNLCKFYGDDIRIQKNIKK
ncbi:MAG: replication protein DnaC [Clostridiaceae bacterium]|jgi:DNA replication protein DnaC|nr:replication protein DnaC [Clostridiaceae bacterium]